MKLTVSNMRTACSENVTHDTDVSTAESHLSTYKLHYIIYLSLLLSVVLHHNMFDAFLFQRKLRSFLLKLSNERKQNTFHKKASYSPVVFLFSFIFCLIDVVVKLT